MKGWLAGTKGTKGQIWWEDLLGNVQFGNRVACGTWEELAQHCVLSRAFVFGAENKELIRTGNYIVGVIYGRSVMT